MLVSLFVAVVSLWENFLPSSTPASCRPQISVCHAPYAYPAGPIMCTSQKYKDEKTSFLSSRGSHFNKDNLLVTKGTTVPWVPESIQKAPSALRQGSNNSTKRGTRNLGWLGKASERVVLGCGFELRLHPMKTGFRPRELHCGWHGGMRTCWFGK